MHYRLVGPITILLGISACADEPDNTTSRTEVVASVERSSPALPEPIVISAEDEQRICRAAVAVVNGRDPEIINVISHSGGIVRVRYTRPDDGKVWTNECKIRGDRVVWRTVDAFGPGSGTGRWRDGRYDETMTFVVNPDTIEISTRYPDGSGSNEEFRI